VIRVCWNSNLGKYFQNNELPTIVLHGPKGQIPCKLLIRAKFVKIGDGWKMFYDAHGLKEKKKYVLIF